MPTGITGVIAWLKNQIKIYLDIGNLNSYFISSYLAVKKPTSILQLTALLISQYQSPYLAKLSYLLANNRSN